MPVKKQNAPSPNLSAFDLQFGVPVCGIDEAGRGPLAGPVMAACVYIPPENLGHAVWREVNDSKKLTAAKRDYLFELIQQRCVFSIAQASAAEIDHLNIHHATLLAMKRAYDGIAHDQDTMLALIDGKFAPQIGCRTQTVVKGDATSMAIAAASILAKVARDRIMDSLHAEYPHYGWGNNAGYGTPEHMAGIAAHGITPHHRKSFAPCKLDAARASS